MDLIDRQALLSAFQNPELFNITPKLLQMIREAPTVDAAPVLHGRWNKGWIDTGDGPMPKDAYVCSVCRKAQWRVSNFCPNCGRIMDQ